MKFRRWKLLLSDKYPFLTEYFTKAVSSNTHPFPQSILFYGNDYEAQYILANEIARLLNCNGNKSDNCNCLNCKWIRENTHPAIMTFSKVDNKPEDDNSKTVISIKQTALIKERLINDSEFHRVFIMCDNDKDGNIAGLNRTNFQDDAANSLLKIIEEPQEHVTFIFITRYIEDVISTIVSRSQCFFVPSMNEVNYDYSDIVGIFDNYWTFQRKNAFDISKRLQDLVKDLEANKILDEIQNYIYTVLRNNPKNADFINDIRVLEECKQQAKAGIKPPNIFDDLCLKLIK